jgi:hypothetical protein
LNKEQTAYRTPVFTIIPGRKTIVAMDRIVFLVQETSALLFPVRSNAERINVAVNTTRGAIFTEKMKFVANR